jgi:hypothetical protein
VRCILRKYVYKYAVFPKSSVCSDTNMTQLRKQDDETREKGRGAVDLSTRSYISLVLLGREWRGRRTVTRVEGIEIVKGGGRASPLSASLGRKYHHD